jgi:DNA-binding NtrC family response regulator
MPEITNHPIQKHEIIGESPWATKTREQIRRAAARNANVLIIGPTGTGKDLIARGIHSQGSRASCPFMIVDCAAASSESHDLIHAFSAAEGGTIFLDEIGDLDLACQARLLRAIDSRPTATSRAQIGMDVRVVASSNRNLASDVAAGRFRADLYYRLRVITIEAAPLNTRQVDIPLLTSHFLAEIAADENEPPRCLSAEASAELIAYSWPGNVRELRNTIERAVAFADGPTIEAGLVSQSDAALLSIATPASAWQDEPSGSEQFTGDHSMAGQILQFNDGSTNDTSSNYSSTGAAATSSVDALKASAGEVDIRAGLAQPYRMMTAAENERLQILTAMQMSDYNQSRAATMLGVTRQQLRRRIAKHFPETMPTKRGRPRTQKAA